MISPIKLVCILFSFFLFAFCATVSAKTIIINFEGTGNDDGPLHEDVRKLIKEDDGITNVLKTHLLLGGTLDPDNQLNPEQLSFYLLGVGKDPSRYPILGDVGAKLSSRIPGREIDQIEGEAQKILDEHYTSGDEVFFFGFSWGAAIARRFAQTITTRANSTIPLSLNTLYIENEPA